MSSHSVELSIHTLVRSVIIVEHVHTASMSLILANHILSCGYYWCYSNGHHAANTGSTHVHDFHVANIKATHNYDHHASNIGATHIRARIIHGSAEAWKKSCAFHGSGCRKLLHIRHSLKPSLAGGRISPAISLKYDIPSSIVASWMLWILCFI